MSIPKEQKAGSGGGADIQLLQLPPSHAHPQPSPPRTSQSAISAHLSLPRRRSIRPDATACDRQGKENPTQRLQQRKKRSSSSYNVRYECNASSKKTPACVVLVLVLTHPIV
ncbi:hypothetical protein M409DRAFT_49908 [Zasmidium cellare ATCC 36951]|uniref:Uncharacterized protein n=1 Tax=Zasmidium cellare ATCC 36951 TaxID=1080233 RepID=A0A6A6D1W2_ZASCE|nr:uncharacterized protein M409DRAFT_49908 [Zasmidium cellare ATCC 36951]KAF2172172.1 hypothetical protein M409DRAFT_49908 [Zasmidium cellare ATCC 36951]